MIQICYYGFKTAHKGMHLQNTIDFVNFANKTTNKNPVPTLIKTVTIPAEKFQHETICSLL